MSLLLGCPIFVLLFDWVFGSGILASVKSMKRYAQVAELALTKAQARAIINELKKGAERPKA